MARRSAVARWSVVSDLPSCQTLRRQTRVDIIQQLLAVNPVQRPRARNQSGLRVAVGSIDSIAEMGYLRPKSCDYRLVVSTMQKRVVQQRLVMPNLVLRVGLSHESVALANIKNFLPR